MRPGPSTMLERYKGLYKLQAKHRIPTHRCDIGRGQSGQGAFLVQGEGRAFRTPEELLSAVGLYGLTQRSFRDELEVGAHEILKSAICPAGGAND